MEKVEPVQQVQSSVDVAPVLGEPVEKIMKKFESKSKNWVYPLIAVLVIIGGIGSGWVFSGANAKTAMVREAKVATESDNTVTESGGEGAAVDETVEAPEGILREGGAESGDGTHHLERGLGPEKDVYLLSTMLDLDSFVGKKVQIWGTTLAAQGVGWLMDVGKVKVLE